VRYFPNDGRCSTTLRPALPPQRAVMSKNLKP
jgi:hypothetical protein